MPVRVTGTHVVAGRWEPGGICAPCPVQRLSFFVGTDDDPGGRGFGIFSDDGLTAVHVLEQSVDHPLCDGRRVSCRRPRAGGWWPTCVVLTRLFTSAQRLPPQHDHCLAALAAVDGCRPVHPAQWGEVLTAAGFRGASRRSKGLAAALAWAWLLLWRATGASGSGPSRPARPRGTAADLAPSTAPRPAGRNGDGPLSD